MPNTTKQALEAALKKVMLKKPLDKVTIQDITSECGISRMAFYYHFKDIYDLVEWTCLAEAARALEGRKTYATWQDGLSHIFEAVLANKAFILNAYRCISRESMEKFLFRLTYGLIRDVVEEKAVDTGLSEEDKAFISDFYKYSFAGLMLDWIKKGMQEDYRVLARQIGVLMQGSVTNAIENFRREESVQ